MATQTTNKPSANQPAPQTEWLKSSNMRFFKRLDSALRVPQPVGLNHDAIIKILQGQWEVVSRDVYYITITARQILSDKVSAKIYKEEEILKAEKEVFRAFELAQSHFDTRITQAEQILKGAGMSELVMRGGSGLKLFEADSTTRTATKWLELLKKADTYLTLNYQLWVTGEIGPSNWTDGEALSAKLNNERDARTTVTGLTRKINQHYTAIHQLIQKVLEQRRAEEEARRRLQSERDKAKKQKVAAEKKDSQVEIPETEPSDKLDGEPPANEATSAEAVST